MENVKIRVDDYMEAGLGDIYYGLISFISRYATDNYNPLEIFENGESQYAIAIVTMKRALKEILDSLKNTDEVYLPSLNRNVNLSTLNIKEQLALEERCQEYIIYRLNQVLGEKNKKPATK